MTNPADAAPAARKLVAQLEFWSGRCYEADSRLYGHLLERIADDVNDHGACARLLVDHVADPVATALPLRFLAAVHRLVLGGVAPDLAQFYPSAGGWFDPGPERDGHPGPSWAAGRPAAEDPWPAFLAAVTEHEFRLRDDLRRPLQTNEVARCAGLLVGFLKVAELTGLPMRLFEVGASAGFNLRWDLYRFETALWSLGPPSARVTFENPWLEAPPPLAVVPEILQRRGCDPFPLDPNVDDDVLALRSFVWPDHLDRARRLEQAIALARERPVAIDRTSAADWTRRQLATPVAGSVAVVFHSTVMPYLPAFERDRFEAEVASAAARATDDAPVAHLSMEPSAERGPAQVRLVLWPQRYDRVVATTPHHGLPVTCVPE